MWCEPQPVIIPAPNCSSRSQPGLTDLSLDLAQRYSAQQAALGLCAPEIGRLLMQAWELPASIVHGVGDIEQVLTGAARFQAAGCAGCP